MGEVWNSESKIEVRKTAEKTPQLNQLDQNGINVRDIDKILNKLYNNQSIDDFEVNEIINFLKSDLKETYKDGYEARYELLVQYATDIFKEKYTRIFLLENITSNDKNNVIDNLFNNKVKVGSMDSIYKLVSNNPFFLNDKLIDDRVKSTISAYINEEYIKQKEEELSNRKNTNNLLGKELMNSEFKKNIIDSIPDDYNKLEQSIYIYIKLCQLLSYDASYYVDKNNNVKKHEEFEHLNDINNSNTEIICYEFVTLYSELLESIGIASNVTTSFSLGEDENGNTYASSFYDNHANLNFRVDNMLIEADSTTSVLSGDLINAKTGNELNGIKCMSPIEYNHMLFNMALNKVYNNLKETNDFVKYDKNIIEVNIMDRLKMLFDDISKLNVQEVDFVSYIINLKHKYFTDYELKWNININIVGKNDFEKNYPVVIFSVNLNDIINVPQDSIQYLCDTKSHKLIKYENDELKELFNSELFKLEETGNIPGVNFGIRR